MDSKDVIKEVPSDFFDEAVEAMYETDPEDWVGYDDKCEDIEFISEDYDPSQIKCDVTYSLPESKRLDEVYDNAIQLKNERREKCWKISYLNVRSMIFSDKGLQGRCGNR